MNPLIAVAAQVGSTLLTSARPPTQAAVDAAFAQTQAANRKNWLIAGGIVGGALLIYALMSRR